MCVCVCVLQKVILAYQGQCGQYCTDVCHFLLAFCFVT